MLGLSRLGGQGPKLLILHATGFHGLAYRPLAAALGEKFECFALDFPGHGAASTVALPHLDLPNRAATAALADYLVQAVDAHGLRGCFCFGHSAGGAFALLASCQSPGLFSAVYCFEAVAATPASHDFMAAARDSGAITTAGSSLAGMARRRRSLFDSRADAQQRLASKPPFAGMHPEAVRLFVEHGTHHVRPASQHTHAQPPQQQQEQVELVCSPEVEASYYEALDPPPAVPPGRITCPLVLAAAGSASSMGNYTQHAAVRAWLLENSAPRKQQQQHRPGSKQVERAAAKHSRSSVGMDPLHGVLAVLNTELAAALTTAHLEELPGVSHFGPLEKPQLVADSCAAFFLGQIGVRSGSGSSSSSSSGVSSSGGSAGRAADQAARSRL